MSRAKTKKKTNIKSFYAVRAIAGKAEIVDLTDEKVRLEVWTQDKKVGERLPEHELQVYVQVPGIAIYDGYVWTRFLSTTSQTLNTSLLVPDKKGQEMIGGALIRLHKLESALTEYLHTNLNNWKPLDIGSAEKYVRNKKQYLKRKDKALAKMQQHAQYVRHYLAKFPKA